jgi:hypothetical protein
VQLLPPPFLLAHYYSPNLQICLYTYCVNLHECLFKVWRRWLRCAHESKCQITSYKIANSNAKTSKSLPTHHLLLCSSLFVIDVLCSLSLKLQSSFLCTYMHVCLYLTGTSCSLPWFHPSNHRRAVELYCGPAS